MNERVYQSNRVLAAGLRLTSCSMIALAWPAMAQNNAAPEPGGLEEIVVTAQRRAENLQRVPVAVTAVTGETLRVGGIQRTADLQQVTPGLVTTQVGTSFLPFVRGIGSSLSQAGFDSSVAIYIDGVYQANKSATVFELNGIERVEVLKGPQGTLFGRNATGGAINIITKDPGENPELRMEAGYGRFDDKRVRLYASTPLSDTLGLNVSFTRRWDNGYVHDLTFGRVAKTDRIATMGKLVWKPSALFTAKLSLMYNNDSDTAYAVQHVFPGTISAAAARGFLTTSNPFESTLSQLPKAFSHSKAAALNMNYDLGFANIVSITGYRDTLAFSQSDSDLSVANLANTGAPISGKQFSQELQLVSPNSGPFQWITGLYYIWDKQGYTNAFGFQGLQTGSNVPIPTTPASLIPGAPGATGTPSLSLFTTQVTTKAAAIFAQGTYAITNSDRFTAGLRYGQESKSPNGQQYSITSTDGVSFIDTLRNSFNPKTTFSRLTWRFAYDHRFDNNVMAYASYNRGFKSGSYNPSVISPTAPVVNPETLDAYEVGLKSELFDRKLRLNLAGFYYNYRDIQVQLVGPGGALVTENAGKARIYGLDLDMVIAPSPVFTIRGGLNLLDSTYTKYDRASVFLPKLTTAACAALPPVVTIGQARTIAATTPAAGVGGNCTYALDANGLRTVFAPKLTANIGVDYNIPIGQSRLNLAGSAYYNSGYDFSPGGIFAHVNSFETVNASVTFYAPNDRYYVRIWSENLTDDLHPVYLSPQTAAFQVANNRPISYGVTFGANFN